MRAANAETIVGAAGVVLAGTVLAATIGGRAAVYEPLGPWAFPRALSILIGIFAAVILVGGLRRDAAQARPDGAWGLVAAVYLTALAYVLVLTFGWLDYRLATFAFLSALGTLMAGRTPQALATTVVIAATFSLGVYYLMTNVFYITL